MNLDKNDNDGNDYNYSNHNSIDEKMTYNWSITSDNLQLGIPIHAQKGREGERTVGE